MKTARKRAPEAERADLQERAKASRASAARVMGAAPEQAPRPAICAAGELGDMLNGTWIENDEADEKPLVAHMVGVILYRRVQALEVAVSFARASSPTGMLAQLAVAFTALDTAANGSSREICSAAQDQAERCLYSIAAALCALTGVDRPAFMSRYMPLELDRLAVLSLEAAR